MSNELVIDSLNLPINNPHINEHTWGLCCQWPPWSSWWRPEAPTPRRTAGPREAALASPPPSSGKSPSQLLRYTIIQESIFWYTDLALRNEFYILAQINIHCWWMSVCWCLHLDHSLNMLHSKACNFLSMCVKWGRTCIHMIIKIHFWIFYEWIL